jgi:hypothetical protein
MGVLRTHMYGIGPWKIWHASLPYEGMLWYKIVYANLCSRDLGRAWNWLGAGPCKGHVLYIYTQIYVILSPLALLFFCSDLMFFVHRQTHTLLFVGPFFCLGYPLGDRSSVSPDFGFREDVTPYLTCSHPASTFLDSGEPMKIRLTN